VESVKAVSELFSPLSGEVLESNAALVSRPETVNTDPHGEAWMIVLKLADPGAAAALMDAKQYQAHVESESK
jgi:glycine cleavage system H protein